MIRGMKRKLDSSPIKRFDVGTSIHNRFDIEVVNAVSGKVKQKAFAENVVCNGVWSRLCAGNAWHSYIHYGAGSGTPSSSDTSLFEYVGGGAVTDVSSKYDYANNVYSATTKIILLETVAVGVTISEVGIAYGSGSTTLMTHAMLRDMNGNPISIAKTDTDIITIYATVYVHFHLPKGVVHTGLSRYWVTTQSTDYMGYPSSVTRWIAGRTSLGTRQFGVGYGMVGSNASFSSEVTYDVSARSVAIKMNRLAAAEYNDRRGIKNIFLIGVGYAPEFIFEVDPDAEWYTSERVIGESLATGDGITVEYATKFSFVKNAVVYVDGIAVEASVHSAAPFDGLAYYMRVARCENAGSYYYNGGKTRHPFCRYVDGNYSGIATGNGPYMSIDEVPIIENTICDTVGIAKIIVSNATELAVSNNMEDWVYLTLGDVPAEYQNYRYWRFKGSNTNSSYGSYIQITPNADLPSQNNVKLVSPPPAGSVVTIDYDTDTIAKDENHVFDLSIVFKFNEYNEG